MGATTDQTAVRKLYPWEIEEAKLVFADSLDYEHVRVHERATWTDAIHRLGHFLRGKPVPDGEHNAITLGNRCFFPVSMPKEFTGPGDRLGMCWLMHELTHAWQYQHTGWLYLAKALWVQGRDGQQGYEFGGAQGLREARAKNWTLRDFNPEQQGNIAMTYWLYRRTQQPADGLSAWEPFIAEFRNP